MLLSTLFACSPEYKIVHDYIPPHDNRGLTCIDRKCSANRQQCQFQCNEGFKTCLIDQEEIARDNFPEQLSDYYHQMDIYHVKMEQYHHEYERYQQRNRHLRHLQDKALKFCQQKKIEKHQCSDFHHFKKKRNKLYQPYAPSEPMKPSLTNSIHHMQQSCTHNCQCDQQFDKCYIGCGGKVNSRKVCIENCN